MQPQSAEAFLLSNPETSYYGDGESWDSGSEVRKEIRGAGIHASPEGATMKKVGRSPTGAGRPELQQRVLLGGLWYTAVSVTLP